MIAKLLVLTAALVACATTLPTRAGNLAELAIYDRTSGETLPIYRHRHSNYVAGNPGNRYSLRLANRTGQRLMAVLSVDGVNVVTGETAARNQSGYVLDPYGNVEIAGWRKSLNEIAQFYFTPLSDAYAARTARPDNVGVIGVAVYREKVEEPASMSVAPSAPMARAARKSTQADNATAEGTGMQEMASSRLGTGHGQREYAPVQYTEFKRANTLPNELITVRYDSRANLVAKGAIPCDRDYRQREPQPFPGGFVPDPS